MSESQASNAIRPTKKQRELLTYIQEFITEHGYSPSYREIMNGCNYTSVATVALHVNSLISRGHLRKRGRNARSLEVVEKQIETQARKRADHAADDAPESQAEPEHWLLQKIEERFAVAETAEVVTRLHLQELETLVTTLQILGLEAQALAFGKRLETVVAPVSSE